MREGFLNGKRREGKGRVFVCGWLAGLLGDLAGGEAGR